MTTEAAVPEDEAPDRKLSRDLAKAAATLRPHEARFLVDSYYQMQEDRKRSANQVLSLDTGGEPHAVVAWLTDQSKTLEGQLKRALNIYSKADPVGAWSRNILGIGPVLAAGLLAMIDIERAPTAGHIWRFAGLDPTHVWLGREKAAALVGEMVPVGTELTNEVLVKIANHLKRNVESFIRQAHDKKGKLTRGTLTAALARRPWNARLKTLCWKIGESFVKVSGKLDAYYGLVYVKRKEFETGQNEAGKYADQAKRILREKNIGKTTDAYGHYSEGRLPPAQIHARAKRYAVKLFLSHWHHVSFVNRFHRDPPKPYPIAHLDHVEFISPEEASGGSHNLRSA